MLFRAVILFLFFSNACSAGTPLVIAGETGAGVSVCRLGFINPEPASKAEALRDCGLLAGEAPSSGNVVPALADILEPSSDPLPTPKSLVRTSESEEGVDSVDQQFVRYSDSDQREVRAVQGNMLQVFTHNKDNIYAHTFNFESEAAQTYSFPELSHDVDSFSLVSKSYLVAGQEANDIHISPFVIDTRGVFQFWKRTAEQGMGEGSWDDGQILSIPEDLDGFILSTMHSEYSDAAESGFVISHKNVSESGLWMKGAQSDGNGFIEFEGSVSPIDISKSKIIKTHKGLAQFYIEKKESDELKIAHLRFLEESGMPSLIFQATDEFHDLTSVSSQDGTLYIGQFASVSDFLWHASVEDEYINTGIPQGMNSLETCEESQERIFCVMSNFTENEEECNEECEENEGYYLFELIDGQFIEDRKLDHIMLDQGLISVKGIYSHGKNRFVLIQTVDLGYRLFNATPAGTFHNKRVVNRNLDLDVSILSSDTAGVFYLVFASNQSTESVRISANLNADAKAGDDDSTDSRDASDDTDTDEEEEEKEIPFAEMTSSLNIYLLLLSLFVLSPVRFSRK